MNSERKKLLMAALGVSLVGVMATAPSAHAWWRGPGYGGGVYFGFAPPPIVVAPPPVYYAPPAYYPPPVYAAPAAAQGCYAGPYVCPLDTPVAIGGPCSCPANNGRVFGRAG